MYRLTDLSPTPVASLLRAQRVAQGEGLSFIYIGNIPQQVGEDTFCPVCKKRLIHRIGYQILENHIKNGKCSFCGASIPGVWN
jgi:pyruvate formate lyase activating enzyme